MNKQINELMEAIDKVVIIGTTTEWDTLRKLLEDALGQPQAVPASSLKPGGDDAYEDARAELACAEDVLDGIACGLPMQETAFDCIGDYIKAVVAALKPVEPVTWAEAEAITIRPSVEDAIEVLLEDQTLDNATGLVMAVLNAVNPAQTPMQMSQPDERGYSTFTATPPPRLTDAEIFALCKSVPDTFNVMKYHRTVETAVRKQFGYD